jgi:predicted ATPase
MNLKASAPPHSLPKIMGCDIVEQLYFGSRTAVYRALQTVQQRPVVIKVLRREYPSFGELVQFRNQYTIAKNLSCPGIVQPLSLEPLGSGYALVMEDWGGVSLEDYRQQQPLELTEVLAIALQIAEVLHDLSQHQVVHKDIKPANILIHPESKQVKLIDFSIASLLPKETQDIQSPNVLEGTLAYLAPEQTGRMNRGIDYRADFYALGVTLYQLLSGSLPFTSEDPLELVHCHIAKQPVPVDQINPSMPKMVAAIVAKLMAKNAEDRYQSAIGLKHDLQQCLTQWKETGEILAFELGQRDVSDRFLIPEKLYGRESEVQTLLEAFDRVADGSVELMLVAGFSGIGKTAIVNEVHKPITRQNGYFIKGKFDQFNRNVPLSAFVQALRDLMGQLLSESDTQLQTWKTQILDALGENGQVMIEVVPELERIIGAQLPATELSGSAAQNRFNLLFQKFIQVFTTPEHPLVMFLDDLQWADSASLKLIQVLMAESTTGHLLLMGAYRDNEVSAAHPLMLSLDTLRKAKTTINTIALQPLSQNSLNQLIADTLHCSTQLALPLTELVMQKTQGNPFFATQFLKTLHQEHLITFDVNSGYWQCDIVQVRDAALTDDVVEFMAMRLQKLPEATQTVLKLAACIGAQFDLQTLAIVSEQSPAEVAITLWKALQEGLILPQSEVYKFYLEKPDFDDAFSSEVLNYRFLHDRIQQAAYSLIPTEQKQTTHLTIGRLLLQNTSKADWDRQIFAIANQMNWGIDLLSHEVERQELAQLNLRAGQRAKAATAYETALQYFNLGIKLLSQTCWQSQYELALSLHEAAAEVSYLLGYFDQMTLLTEVILSNAQTTLDQVKAYEIRIQTCIARNQLLQGLEVSREILNRLGIVLPEEPSPEDFAQGLQETQGMIAGRNPLELLDLPVMSDAEHLAALRILSSMFAITYNGCPAMFPLVIFKQVCLSIQHGNASFSAFAYASYGLILSAFLGNIETGYEFGQLATQLMVKLDAKEIQAKIISVVNSFLVHAKAPLTSTMPKLLEGYQAGLTTGDIEWASWCAFPYTMHLYLSGENLDIVQQQMAIYHSAIAEFKQTTVAHHQAPYYQTVLNLLGEATEVTQIQGSICDEVMMLPIHQASSNRPSIYHLYINKVMLCYWFGAYETGLSAVHTATQYLDGVPGLYIVALLYFYDSLLRIATANPNWEQIQQNQDRLLNWANHAPMNHQHKWQLVEAERCRLLNQRAEAIELYDRAIAGARANEYIQEEALANELAAKFYLDWGKEKVAAGYMQEAYYCYARWGAKAKTADLETRYPQLLHPVLQAAAQPLNVLETLASIAAPNLSLHRSTQPNRSSSTSVNTALDFAAILKASQSLAGTIQLDELLHQLTHIILQNSGGDRCALILPNEAGEWMVRAIATPEKTQLCVEPLTDNPNLPVKLIQYVKNTQEVIIIDDLKTNLPIIDDYFWQHKPKSLLCLPIPAIPSLDSL